jgi:O-acetyl-ADP-ribose deacetylase (regulator of RNase III)
MSTILRQKKFLFGQAFQIVHGDITQEQVDAIVNAANRRLIHGGGVAGVIVSRGGSRIQQESNDWVRKHGPVSHTEPAYTNAGRLPCKIVIHAVGPIWGEGDEDAKLTSAIGGSLMLAEKLELESIALPAISTGIFGFPKERAAKIIFESIEGFFSKHPASNLTIVRLTLFEQDTVDIFLSVFDSRGETS